MTEPTILATSSGWQRDRRQRLQVSSMGLHAMNLSRRPDTPRVCLVPTASAEDPQLVAAALTALTAAGAVPSVETG